MSKLSPVGDSVSLSFVDCVFLLSLFFLTEDQPLYLRNCLEIDAGRIFATRTTNGQHTGKHAQTIPMPQCTVVQICVLSNNGSRLFGA